jgi:hypothetical protein
MKIRHGIAAALTLVLILSQAQIGLAQTGGGYDLTWNSIDGGGVTFASGGGYELGATIGQADAGPATGGGYALSGGFWAGIPPNYRAFMPITLR